MYRFLPCDPPPFPRAWLPQRQQHTPRRRPAAPRGPGAIADGFTPQADGDGVDTGGLQTIAETPLVSKHRTHAQQAPHTATVSRAQQTDEMALAQASKQASATADATGAHAAAVKTAERSGSSSDHCAWLRLQHPVFAFPRITTIPVHNPSKVAHQQGSVKRHVAPNEQQACGLPYCCTLCLLLLTLTSPTFLPLPMRLLLPPPNACAHTAC